MTRIFLAGAEVETLTRALLDNGADKILYSYWYILQMRRERFIDDIQAEYPHVQFMLDSGAFTYWAKYKEEPERLLNVDEYRRRYFSYIAETWPRWFRIAEFDVDPTGLATADDVAEWREEMLETWPKANIMPVWHPERGPEEWSALVRDPRIHHLAIGSGQKLWGMVRRMIWEARQRNKTVHGFGMTKVNTVLPRVHYTTVDSTAWLMGQKYGTLFIFANNQFKLIGKGGSMGKAERRYYKKHLKAIGVDWDKIQADDVSELRKANILAWRRVSDRLEYMRKRQGRGEPPKDADQFNDLYPVEYAQDRAIAESEEYGRQREPGDIVSHLRTRTEEPKPFGKEREDEPGQSPKWDEHYQERDRGPRGRYFERRKASRGNPNDPT